MPVTATRTHGLDAASTGVFARSQPRFALLSQDVQDAIFQAATSTATGKATPEKAANTLQQSAEAAAK